MSHRARVRLLLAVTAVALLATLFAPHWDLAPGYHGFVDERTFRGIPRTFDVLSNLPFLIAGLAGLAFVGSRRSDSAFENASERLPFLSLFLAITATCFGSAYYHLHPTDAHLFWDRLPMAIGFMSLLAAVIADRVGAKAGVRLLAPLLLGGVASLLYWRWTGLHGHGDLRPYAFVQGYSLLAVILLVLLFPSRYTKTGRLLAALGMYVVAKVFEIADAAVFRLGHIVSGHTLKHLAAGVATWLLYLMVRDRRPVAALRTRAAARQAHLSS